MTGPALDRPRAARDIVSDLLRFTRRAARSIDIDAVAMSDLRADPGRVDELFGRLFGLIVDSAGKQGGDVITPGALASMALEVADLEDEWHRCRRRSAEHGRQQLAASLLRLQSLRTEHSVAEQLCEETCRACGSERALFARITADNWQPLWRFGVGTHSDRLPVSALESLGGLPVERAVVADRRIVHVCGPDHGAHPAAVRRFLRRSAFVIAPVVVEHRVVGLIYAAESGSSPWRDPDLSLRLARFADCVSRHFELLTVRRCLEDQVERAARGLGALQRTVIESDTSVSLMQLVGREQSDPTAAERDSPAASLVFSETEFTAREREVMVLLSMGLDDAQIAERLTVARSTVRSHLQHMLRKAGAVNRAELIGQFYGASAPGAAP